MVKLAVVLLFHVSIVALALALLKLCCHKVAEGALELLLVGSGVGNSLQAV